MTNYLGFAGEWGATGNALVFPNEERHRGIFTNRSRTRIADIKDGPARPCSSAKNTEIRKTTIPD